MSSLRQSHSFCNILPSSFVWATDSFGDQMVEKPMLSIMIFLYNSLVDSDLDSATLFPRSFSSITADTPFRVIKTKDTPTHCHQGPPT